jgi:2-polyprenyl-3-methyl-5-hydroxy-6-metoxy-1,4-benzoquinol methylase
MCEGGGLSDWGTAPDRFHLRTKQYQLAHCKGCGIVWQMNPPAPHQMGKHYTEEYHKAIVAAGEGSAAARWKSQVQLIRKLRNGGTILDLGCSSGGFLNTMKGIGWDLYGIEMEASTAARAVASTGAKVFVGDILSAQFSPASFDVITCFDVLEHVYAPQEFLQKVLTWLKPGGIFYAMMPNIGSWEARLFGTYWFGLELPRHLFHFSPRSLLHIMSKLGFEKVLLRTPPVSYAQRSVNYVFSSVLDRFGFTPTPQATPREVGFAHRAARKTISLGVWTPIARFASFCGAGPSMEVVFSKPLNIEGRRTC